ncbi:hypothetical protein pclt_cds_976 [Pandoravirus celtis]|uniref:Uncharacterized protein n=1 Tax=Pandoravirus celtis TaxID=2568002 RepID=A0A4D6EJT5_9VIRU|nr:hypothetical protein pclt_cds_976 [Pandoravirus celtis]
MEEIGAAPTHGILTSSGTPSCLARATLACIAVVFTLQMILVGAVVGTLVMRSPENAAECERLVNWLFTSVCFASVVAAAAVVAQAWHDRGKDAALVLSANTYGACDAGRRDIASILGGDRVCGRVWRGQPQSDPVMCHAAWHIDRWQGVTSTTSHFDASGADSLGAFEACGVACMRADNGGMALAWTQTYTTLLGQCEPLKNHAAARYAFRGAMTMDADGGATIRGAWSRVEAPGADTRPGDFVSGRFVLVLTSIEADIEAAPVF